MEHISSYYHEMQQEMDVLLHQNNSKIWDIIIFAHNNVSSSILVKIQWHFLGLVNQC